MRHNKYLVIALASMSLISTSCADIDDQNPIGQVLTDDQKNESESAIPSRVEASLVGMYSMMGKMGTYFGEDANGTATPRDDDGGYPSICLSNDLNGPDMVADNSGYNWFSVASDYSDRTANYANPRMRYGLFYNQIGAANEIIGSISDDDTNEQRRQYLGQALACRAFSYLNLAPYYQFNYATSKDKPCVPIVTESTADVTNNPRATVEKVYKLIISDLNRAKVLLKDYSPKNNSYANLGVVNGLLARAYLAMGMYAEAANSAKEAISTTSATPASRAEVSHPAFCNMSEHNWMWAISTSATDAAAFPNPQWASQLGSFSGNGYTTALAIYRRINSLLYIKISDTDIRKQWWVDENLHSSLLDGQKWVSKDNNGKETVFEGQDIATGVIADQKLAFVPYTNVKFGMKSSIGSSTNSNDWPLMRVEEMYLIQAEGLAMSGQLEAGKNILEQFVKNYRDPNYTCKASSAEQFQNEVWFQRRIELWGEGFSMFDIMRLHKPVVRFHGTDTENWPAAYCFNMSADDPYLLMRFSQKETNNNKGIVDNTGGTVPQSMQNPNIKDGVTD